MVIFMIMLVVGFFCIAIASGFIGALFKIDLDHVQPHDIMLKLLK